MPTLVMFIGVPGSGKSTAAQKFKSENPEFADANIWEADMFFIDKDGIYNWNPTYLGMAHSWCKAQVRSDMIYDKNVIVSNTNLTPKERKPYFDLAKEYNYDVKVIYCDGGYKNIHNVPDETIEKMKQRYIPFSSNELNR